MPRLKLKPTFITPLESLLTDLRGKVYLPDPHHLYVVLGTVAGNMLEGPSIYTMLVGPPAAGGGTILNPILGLYRVVEASGVNGEAAFLSGTPKKDKTLSSTGGLLRDVGTHGLLVFKDFTSVFGRPNDKYVEIMNCLRECHDGHWTRPVGTDGGIKLHWHGKLGCLAKTTSVIDLKSEMNSLGERWVYFRFPKEANWEQSRAALLNTSDPGWTKQLQQRINDFFAEFSLSFGSGAPIVRRTVSDKESLYIYRLGQIAVRGRSSVLRDRYTKETVGLPELEGEARITQTLGQLLVGMEYIGVPSLDIWQILEKIAFDSIPSLKRLVLDEVIASRDEKWGISPLELAERVKLSYKAVIQAAEDLEIHGLVEINRAVRKLWVRKSPWLTRELLALRGRN